jgi:hypothetical protein
VKGAKICIAIDLDHLQPFLIQRVKGAKNYYYYYLLLLLLLFYLCELSVCVNIHDAEIRRNI